jgi:hypothetical protein
MWKSRGVANHGEGMKQLRLPGGGTIALEHPSFTVDGRPELGMVVYNPATLDDAARVRRWWTRWLS